MVKYPCYQDYVIRNGKFIGKFEEMYQDFDDPWNQSNETSATDKRIALELVNEVSARKILDVGCGLGHFSNQIQLASTARVLGIDISATAIRKATESYLNCSFAVADILDFHVYRNFNPDTIIMAEVSWYVLDKLKSFLSFLRYELPHAYLIHTLTTYPPGVQKHGTDTFTNLPEILTFFDMNYYKSGECQYPDGCKRTYFIGRFTNS